MASNGAMRALQGDGAGVSEAEEEAHDAVEEDSINVATPATPTPDANKDQEPKVKVQLVEYSDSDG